MCKSNTFSSYQTSFKVTKPKETSRNSTSPGTDPKSPSYSIPSVTLDKSNKTSIHKWAKQDHRSLVFSLGKNNDLTAKKKDVPGTSIIRILHRKEKYVYPKTETIKFPQMSGTRLFGADPTSFHPQSINTTPQPEFVLTGMDQLRMSRKHTSSPEESGVMNVKPFTNHEPGVSSKFSIQKSATPEPSLPGTSIIFPATEVVIPTSKQLHSILPSIKLDNQSSKDWQVFTVNSSQGL